MLTLVFIPYSPFSEAASWALDHHRVAYRKLEYVPMLAEPWLRWRTGRFSGRVTAPVLLGAALPGGFLDDSVAIARHADGMLAHGSTARRLFPDAQLETVLTFAASSQRALAAARPLVTARIALSDQAGADSLPSFIPRPLRGGLAPMARIGASFLAWKYDFSTDEADGYREVMRAELVALRRALEKAGGRYLCGEFSFADIAMATVLQFVEPADPLKVPLGEALRAANRDPVLAGEMADLCAWRDEIYRQHRPLPS